MADESAKSKEMADIYLEISKRSDEDCRDTDTDTAPIEEVD